MALLDFLPGWGDSFSARMTRTFVEILTGSREDGPSLESPPMPDWNLLLLGGLGGGLFCLGAIFLGIRFALGRFIAGLFKFPQVPPARITAQTIEDKSEYPDPPIWEGQAALLKSKGFRKLVDFTIAEIPGMFCLGYLHPNGSYSVLYSHPQLGTWWDIALSYGVREQLLVSSNVSLKKMEAPPFCKQTVIEEASIEAGLEIFEELQGKSAELTQVKIPTDADSFLRLFEEDYANQSDWRNAHTLPTKEQIKAELSSEGREPGEDEVQQLWESTVYMMLEFLDMGLRHRYEDSLKDTTRRRFRSADLLCVYDTLAHERLLERLSQYLDERDTEQYETTGLPPKCHGQTTREAFKTLQSLLPEEVRFEHLGSLDFPLDADIYLAPRSAIPIDVFPHRHFRPED